MRTCGSESCRYDGMSLPDPSPNFVTALKRLIREIILDQQPLVIVIARIEPLAVD